VKLLERLHDALVRRLYAPDAYVVPTDFDAPDFFERVNAIAVAQRQLKPWTLVAVDPGNKDLTARRRSLLMRLVTALLNAYRRRHIAARERYFSPDAVARRRQLSQNTGKDRSSSLRVSEPVSHNNSTAVTEP
jgi:hypothetical protein